MAYKLVKNGHSIQVVLPKAYCELLNWNKGDKMTHKMDYEKKRLIISKW